MRSGRTLSAAVADADEATAPQTLPFPNVTHHVARGRSLADAFRDVPADPATATGLAAPVLATCADLGGAASAPIDRVADVLIARANERDERQTASAQARLSAQVLTIVPIAVAGLLGLVEPSIRHTLATPAGFACVAVGGTLDAVGWCWMRRMIGRPT